MRGNSKVPHDGGGRRPWPLPAVALALGLGMAPAGGALATEMLVVGSTAPAFAAGDVAPTGREIEIPADSQVTLVAPSGGVVKIEGPWSGSFGGASAEGDGGLISRLYALFQMPDKRRRFGATRSATRCLVVDLAEDDDICVARPSCVVFQSDGAPQEPVSMASPDGQTIALNRGVGSGMWRWPGDQVRQSGSYLVRAGRTLTPKSLDVHIQPDDLPTPAHEIAWMGERGCVRQAQEALASLVAD